MRLSTAHLDHLIVPPAIQRLRHREFHRRMWAPPSLIRQPEAEPGPLPQPPPEPPTIPALAALAALAELATIGRPKHGTDEECLRWMQSEFLRLRLARPHLSPIIVARLVGARAFGVKVDAMASPDRRYPLVRIRMKTMAFAKIMTNASLPAVGRAFGGRDHTTVLHAVRRFGGLVREALAPPIDNQETTP